MNHHTFTDSKPLESNKSYRTTQTAPARAQPIHQPLPAKGEFDGEDLHSSSIEIEGHQEQ